MNLADFEKQLQKAGLDCDEFYRDAVNNLAGRVLTKVRKLTPVGKSRYEIIDGERQKVHTGGSLRKKWHVKPAHRTVTRYRAVVINNLKYASYVEYGHRQEVGRYVPVLGKRLKEPWIPGAHMLLRSHNEVNRKAQDILRRRFRAFLKEHLT